MRSVEIGETLRWALAKIIMRADGDQAKTACINLQLCAGLESGIERATHAIYQRQTEQTTRSKINKYSVDEMEDKEEV